MENIKHFLRLIRVKNLLMIVVTQFVVRYGLLYAMLMNDYKVLDVNLSLQLPFVIFLCLVLATVFICASGYIINDYFDVNTDMINKPDKVVIGKHINRRFAMLMHWLFNIVGVILGGIASVYIGHWNFTILFVLIAMMLWLYSVSFSKQAFVGNIVVALLVAMVPLIIAIFELIPLNNMYYYVLKNVFLSFEILLFWSLGYALFAFLLTLIREIVKDIEDLQGDVAYGRTTVPITLGIPAAKFIVSSLIVITVGALLFVFVAYLFELLTGLYLLFGIILPLCVALILFIRAQESKQYYWVSQILKLIMLLGLIYIPIKHVLFV